MAKRFNYKGSLYVNVGHDGKPTVTFQQGRRKVTVPVADILDTRVVPSACSSP